MIKRIKIPVIIGKNRLRGNATGAMIEDDFSTNNLECIRTILLREGLAAGVEVSTEWITKSVSQLLKLYETEYAKWMAAKNDTAGFVWEACMPSGTTVLMGTRQALAYIC